MWDSLKGNVYVESPEDVERRAKQLDINCRFLIQQIEQIHNALCPGKIGTWQDRATQSVRAAQKIAKERKGKDKGFKEVMREAWLQEGDEGYVIIDGLRLPFFEYRHIKDDDNRYTNTYEVMVGENCHKVPRSDIVKFPAEEIK